MDDEKLEAMEDHVSLDFVDYVTGESGIAAFRRVLDGARRLQGEG